MNFTLYDSQHKNTSMLRDTGYTLLSQQRHNIRPPPLHLPPPPSPSRSMTFGSIRCELYAGKVCSVSYEIYTSIFVICHLTRGIKIWNYWRTYKKNSLKLYVVLISLDTKG